jgi:hypothetical protein
MLALLDEAGHRPTRAAPPSTTFVRDLATMWIIGAIIAGRRV